MEALGTEISWPSRKPREKQSRIHNHHVSLRDRIKELQSRSHGKHPKEVERGPGGHEETTKAVAWAVFQHHGEGGVGHGLTHRMAVRRPTRFKIEAQMKQEVAHRSVYEALAFRWDAGSTLFDSFELNSLLKTLNEAAHAPSVAMAQQKHHVDEDEAGAMVVYPPKSPTHWTQRHSFVCLRGEGETRRLDTVDEMRPSEVHGEDHGQRPMRYNLTDSIEHGHNDAKDDSSSVFGHWYAPKDIRRRSFDSSNDEKPANGKSDHHHHHHHHNRWKSLLHTLHLDGANENHGFKNLLHTLHLDGANGLFHGFQKSHTQVAPHDLEKTQEERGRSQRDHGTHGDVQLDKELYDGHFERNELHIAKEVDLSSEKEDGRHPHRHHPHFWKFGFKTALTQPFCRPGHLLNQNQGSSTEDQSHKGHKKYRGHRHADLRAAWSSLTANLLHHHREHKHEHEHGRQRDALQGEEHSVIEHHHHHHHNHHHVQPEGEDNEMNMQAISMRVTRTSLDEKTTRLSIEEGGLKAPRNSLETPIWA